MHLWGRTVKAIFTWVSLLLVIPTAIASVQGQGLTRTLMAMATVLLAAAVWNWRTFLHTVQNVELTHILHVLNSSGDVRYEQRVSILPLFWSIKKHQMSMMNLSTDGQVCDIATNCEVDWTVKDNQCWKGIAKVPEHLPLLSFRKMPKGTLISIAATMPGACATPPYGLSVATTKRPPLALHIRIRWNQGVAVNIVDISSGRQFNGIDSVGYCLVACSLASPYF